MILIQIACHYFKGTKLCSFDEEDGNKVIKEEEEQGEEETEESKSQCQGQD